jgi:hypothetical protein
MARGVQVLTHNPALDLSQYMSAVPEWQNVADRGFGDATKQFRAQVVVDEDHEDDLQITTHPVQMGVVVHDHAFKQPATVRCRMGWSNGYAFDINLSNVRQVYEDILRLQARRLPFMVFTGKRVYENMLVASLRTHTDQKLEYTLMADVEFREIVMVGTSVGGGVGTQDAQADPESTTPQSERGPAWVQPARIPTEYAVRSGIPITEIAAFSGQIVGLPQLPPPPQIPEPPVPTP